MTPILITDASLHVHLSPACCDTPQLMIESSDFVLADSNVYASDLVLFCKCCSSECIFAGKLLVTMGSA